MIKASMRFRKGDTCILRIGNFAVSGELINRVGKRLDTMLQAVKTVRSALDDFYGQLSDEQKASFEAIGPQRTTQADQPAARQTRYHRRIGVGSVIRQMLRTF